jgi:hypothetical protein
MRGIGQSTAVTPASPRTTKVRRFATSKALTLAVASTCRRNYSCEDAMNPRKLACMVGWLGTLAACGGSGNESAGSAPAVAVPAAVEAALPGYSISASLRSFRARSEPDDLLVHGGNIFVIAQDPNDNPGRVDRRRHEQRKARCSNTSTSGNCASTRSTSLGIPDGLMEFDANTVWVSTNEDANPLLIIIDTATKHAEAARARRHADPRRRPGRHEDCSTGSSMWRLPIRSVGLASATAPNGVSTVPALYTLITLECRQCDVPPDAGHSWATPRPRTSRPILRSRLEHDGPGLDGRRSERGPWWSTASRIPSWCSCTIPGPNQTVRVLPLNLYGNALAGG